MKLQNHHHHHVKHQEPEKAHHKHHAHGAHGAKGATAAQQTQAATAPQTPVTNGFDATNIKTPGGDTATSTLPSPGPEQTAPTPGTALQQGGEFGPNAIKTPGGYTIVPEGKDMAWSVYAPGQKPGETPNTRVWGDPHVQEKDGGRWDFTNNTNFRLPDGTNIAVKTTLLPGSAEGYRVTDSLDITNGFDHMSVSGLAQNKPVVGEKKEDGYLSRANLESDEAFVLGGDANNVKWFKTEKGKDEGEITGASMQNGAYQQTVNADSKYAVDPSLQPKVGTPAWGNKLRDEAIDTVRNVFGKGSMVTDVVAFGAAVQNYSQNVSDSLRTNIEKPVENFFERMQRSMSMFNLFNLSHSHKRHAFQAT